MLGVVDSVAHFITINEQSESNPHCNFHSSNAYFASGISYHQNSFIYTVAGDKCLCGGRKKSLVQFSIFSSLSGSSNVVMCIKNCLNQTQTAVSTLLLHFLLPEDHITRIYY